LRELEENGVRNAAKSLVQQAVDGDGSDNATLVHVSITTGP
jgi:serine/threonine protein phosphatase PrpC